VEGKSPNRHNKFYFEVEPLGAEVVDKIQSEGITVGKNKVLMRDKLVEAGMDKAEAKKVLNILEGNVLVDMTKGVRLQNKTCCACSAIYLPRDPRVLLPPHDRRQWAVKR